ncbi:MAG TPA: DNA replication and repair protein RecF [Verrucomicrobiales bacterium]|jgi:DNA replication and repair protein RecF|nr:DNA replication and repair protein RecF [Verrucomicrobiales bacterium]
MPLTSLRLQDFRCYSSLRCTLTGGVTLFVGDNAQGKTSLLEAVCVLLRLQSPRCQGAKELPRFGSEAFGVAGTLNGRELKHTGGAVRELSIDTRPARRPGDYLAASGLVVWMGNGDIELVSGSSEARRRYLDFLGTQVFPEYRNALRSYEKALRARNLLLRRDATPAWRQVDAWTEVLVEHGSVLRQLRAELVTWLTPKAAAAHREISSSDEALTLSYEPGCGENFAAQLAEARGEEERRRVTFLGPHRDDVAPAINGLPAARFASEGQQRTIALALKLAQSAVLSAQRKTDPILLIDDIFGELDPRRRNALLHALPPASQKLITTTHLHWLAGSFQPDAVWNVSAGELTPRDLYAVPAP